MTVALVVIGRQSPAETNGVMLPSAPEQGRPRPSANGGKGGWKDTHPVGKKCAQSVPEPWLSPVPLGEGGPDSRGRREGDWEDGCRVRQSGPKPWRMEGFLRRDEKHRSSGHGP